MSDLSLLLQQVVTGDQHAQHELLNAVFNELRHMASAQMARENPGCTLQPTALVHEAWLRLIKSPMPHLPETPGASRRYFFAAAAEAMRRILVEKARHTRAVKHGGQLQREHADLDQFPQTEPDDELLAVHEALDQLAAHDALKAELVKLRYFAGFTNEEACGILGITQKSGEKQWVYARAWLKSRLQS